MKQDRRSLYIPKGATKVADKQSDAVAYLYVTSVQARGAEPRALPAAALFIGKQQKPAAQFRYSNEGRREAAIREFFRQRQERLAWVAARREERKAFAHSCQVGDIYRTSWGYDQTNVEFFEVVEIRGKYAVLREIASASEGGGPGGERCVPQSGAFLEPRHEKDDQGRPIRRLIQSGHIKIDDVRYAWPWGKRVAGVVVGPAAHRTSLGWGH